MLPRAYLAGEEACMVLQASSLSGRIYSKEMMLAISEERCCVVSVVGKKKKRDPFLKPSEIKRQESEVPPGNNL